MNQVDTNLNKVQVKVAGVQDMGELLMLRKEFLELELGADMPENMVGFYEDTRKYLADSFAKKEQSSCIAYVDGRPVGCAMLCYLHLLPTLEHPTGNRAHLMNVYVQKEVRRLHIGTKMIDLLIEEGRKYGITEISLDATELGMKLYEKYGFVHNGEAMVIKLKY